MPPKKAPGGVPGTRGSTLDNYVDASGGREADLIEQFKDMLDEAMKNMEKSMRDNLKEVIGKLEEKQREERECWIEEKRVLEDRIEKLEWKEEKKEREGRRLNIVIKGVEWNEGDGDREVEKFLQEKMGTVAKIDNSHVINAGRRGKMMVAELENMEIKKEVMRAKKGLIGTKIYVDNDLTRKERVVQGELRKTAMEQRKEGKEGRVIKAPYRIYSMNLAIEEAKYRVVKVKNVLETANK